MAIASRQAYKTALASALRYAQQRNTISSHTGFACSFMRTPLAPSTPSTAAALDRTSAGGIGQINASGTQRFGGIDFLQGSGVTGGANRCSGPYVLIDRLSHQGGLSGTATGAQTTNLPTAALTRYTTGAGVLIGLEIYTSIGTGGATVTASYTNQAGTSGRTSEATTFGAAGLSSGGAFIVLPFQVGDSGARSVESVTLSGSTGTAGNFGVVLFKPLGWWSNQRNHNQSFGWNIISSSLQAPVIQSDACLCYLQFAGFIATQGFNAVLTLVQD